MAHLELQLRDLFLAVQGAEEMADSFAVPVVLPSERRAARQLVAMRLLFDTERDHQRTDVLLATIFEALIEGPRTTDELARQVQADWPGVVIPREVLERTLQEATQQQFVSRLANLAGSTTWVVGDKAELRVDESRQWAADVLARCRGQVQDRAQEAGLVVSHEQAERWTTILHEVLDEEVQKRFVARPADVRVVDRHLFPPYDRDGIVRSVRARADDAEVANFLAALALSALDPQSPFGTELVHYVATGFVLYGFMLGLDLLAAREEVGTLDGEVILLDTPVLLRLLGGGEAYRWTADLVGRMARSAGARVVVAKRTRRELDDALRHRDGDARAIERELKDGVLRERLAAATGDQVLVAWLGLSDGTTWNDFKAAADSVLATLRAMGVEIDVDPPPGNLGEIGAARSEFIEALQSVLADRGKERHRVPIEHDAEMLCFASSLRRGKERPHEVWPGAVIMTSDRALNPAYASLMPDDRMPVALTVSQVAAVLARFAGPRDMETLARTVVDEASFEARLHRSASVSTEQAIEMARSFQGERLGDLVFESESLQLTFEGILATTDATDDPTKAVREAILRQERRRKGAAAAQREESDRARARDRERAVAAESRASTLEEVNRSKQVEIEGLANVAQARDHEVAELRRVVTSRTRLAISIAIYAIALIGLVWLAVAGVIHGAAVLLPALGLAGASKWFYDWVVKPDVGWASIAVSIGSWGGLLGAGRLLNEVLSKR